MKIVFLNAPPRAGKASLATALQNNDSNVIHFKFAYPLKRIAHSIIGMPDIPINMFEHDKDRPSCYFPLKDLDNRYTPREFYIKISEEMLKPMFGQDYFGKMLIKDIQKSAEENSIFVISDSGFWEEAKPVVAHFGEKTCLQVRILRENGDFSKDSRAYWSPQDGYDIQQISLENSKDNLGRLNEMAKIILGNCQ